MPSGISELARLFLRLSCIAFGGPAAHVALMRDEVVERRRWLTDQQFLDLLGATNLLPGPNSTEMAMQVGRLRAGWPGATVAGAAFILPASAIVLALAWAYRRYGALPEVGDLLYGIKPVVVAVIAVAVWRLLGAVLKGVVTAAIAAASLALYVAGLQEIPILLFGGLAAIALTQLRRRAAGTSVVVAPASLAPLAWSGTAASGMAPLAWSSTAASGLFLPFLKIGALLFGSGYVLIAFLHSEFVEPGLLTSRQLVNAVAVGQMTPGPVLTAATFVGYILGGVPGAVVATAAIFFPAFVYVFVAGPVIPRLRRHPVLGAALDGVNAAAVALMVVAGVTIGREAIVDPVTAVVALAALLLHVRLRVGLPWLLLGAGAVGVAARAVAG